MNLRWTPMAGIVLAGVLIVAGTALAANPEQSGSGTTCVDSNAGYFVDGLVVANHTRNTVEVDPGTGFKVSSDSDDPVYVDFYNDEGEWIDWNAGDSTGTVPTEAAFGSVCVGVLGGYPDAPNPTATWTYQDGF